MENPKLTNIFLIMLLITEIMIMAICFYTDDGNIEYDDELGIIAPVLYNAPPIRNEKEYVTIPKSDADSLIHCVDQ